MKKKNNAGFLAILILAFIAAFILESSFAQAAKCAGCSVEPCPDGMQCNIEMPGPEGNLEISNPFGCEQFKNQ